MQGKGEGRSKDGVDLSHFWDAFLYPKVLEGKWKVELKK